MPGWIQHIYCLRVFVYVCLQASGLLALVHVLCASHRMFVYVCLFIFVFVYVSLFVSVFICLSVCLSI